MYQKLDSPVNRAKSIEGSVVPSAEIVGAYRGIPCTAAVKTRVLRKVRVSQPAQPNAGAEDDQRNDNQQELSLHGPMAPSV